jgi:hypothetical protein
MHPDKFVDIGPSDGDVNQDFRRPNMLAFLGGKSQALQVGEDIGNLILQPPGA